MQTRGRDTQRAPDLVLEDRISLTPGAPASKDRRIFAERAARLSQSAGIRRRCPVLARGSRLALGRRAITERHLHFGYTYPQRPIIRHIADCVAQLDLCDLEISLCNVFLCRLKVSIGVFGVCRRPGECGYRTTNHHAGGLSYILEMALSCRV
jgi:hypothetical protein